MSTRRVALWACHCLFAVAAGRVHPAAAAAAGAAVEPRGAAVPALPAAGGTRLLRFPDVWRDKLVFSYGGDLWTASTAGGTATRLTANPGLELFAKFSPDGQQIAFTAQYGGDEQVYVIPANGGAPRQLTFYPANGPLVERWGYDNQVYGWTADGRSVLFRSMRDAYQLTDSRLYTVPAAGGASSALPMPVSGAGHFSPDGRRIVYSPLWRDFRSEKRYSGGWANDLFIFDLEKPSLLQVTSDPRTDRDPMWIGDSIYFNSDRTGVFNLYRYDIASRSVTALTHYTDWDVRWPSADADGQIVYELAGGLHILDTRSGSDRALSIVVPADDTSRRPHAVNAADNIESISVSPGGERALIAARGDIFTVPIEHGVTRNLTRSSNAHDREPAWSSDGRRIAYVSDRSGEEQVYVQAQDGNSPPEALTAGEQRRYYLPLWSPDDKRIAISDQTGRIEVIDIASRRRTTLATDPLEPLRDYQWSPDGRLLAYSLHDTNGYAGVFIWSTVDHSSHRITPELFNAQEPAWSPSGDLIYFLSAREYAPLVSTIEFEVASNRQTGIFAVTLRKDAANPFRVENDDPGTAAADAAPEPKKSAPDPDGHGTAGRRKSDLPKPAALRPLHVEFGGIVDRVIRVPLDPDNYSNLVATGDALLYQRNPAPYYGREPEAKPSLLAYSIKDREAKTVADDVLEWSATADGKHVLAELGSRELKYLDVSGKSDDAKSVSLAGLATTRVPAQEWREIFAEVWRRYRDYFYVANMHGFDWLKIREKYAPLLDSLGDRADLNYVIAEMIAELTVQHAYIEGGDLGLPKRPYVGLPGARFALDPASGRYRIARIFVGQNEEELYRSPLTEVGVEVHAGDYLLAINGRELGTGRDPYELLETAANQPVEWRVAPTPDGEAARTIRYQPLASERNLIYLDWVMANRARVRSLSQGRLAYVHLPDMEDAGLREFMKWWYPQVRQEGLIVDVRDNGGGNVSALLIERLARRLGGLDFGRNYAVPLTYPGAVQPGPKAALINEETASDGDIFAHAFRAQGLGPLIGKRTWGGAVGIVDRGPLLDGGTTYVPEFGSADADGHWMIEGHGVDPDITVEQDPIQVMQGRDPQLERAILELMQRLPPTPAGLPPRPAPPVKAP